MKKAKLRVFALVLALLWLFAGCAVEDQPGTTGGTQQTDPKPTGDSVVPNGAAGTPVHMDFEKTDEDMFAAEDYRDSYEKCVTVTLNGNSMTSTSDSVRQSGK